MKSHSAADTRPNQLQNKSPTGSLSPAVPLEITRFNGPWTHTSDDSYMYRLSLVVAIASISLASFGSAAPACIGNSRQDPRGRREEPITTDRRENWTLKCLLLSYRGIILKAKYLVKRIDAHQVIVFSSSHSSRSQKAKEILCLY